VGLTYKKIIMTVLEIFKKYDFESVLPHLDHLFVVNSRHHLSDASIEVFRGIYTHWANECEPKPTGLYIELASRWEMTNSLIDWNCSVNDKKGLLYSAAEHKDKIEVLSMEVIVRDDVEISEVDLAAGLFWEMTYLKPKKDC
jgi:hypothetical protein